MRQFYKQIHTTMRKSFIYTTLLLAVMALGGCKERQTPDTSHTSLWPAYDPATEKWGFINKKGEFAIYSIFDHVGRFSCGYARVWIPGTDTPIFIDPFNRIYQGTYDCAEDFYYKYARVLLNGNYGLMNTSFDMSCQPVYYEVRNMSIDGLAAAKLSSKLPYGYINKKGEWKIKANYDEASDFDHGIAVVRVGDDYGAINKDGAYVIPLSRNRLYQGGQGLVFFEEKGKFGAKDKEGNVVIQALYDSLCLCADNDLVPAFIDGKCGYISTSGATQIAFTYDDASPFCDGYAAVYTNGITQIINKKGKPIITLQSNERLYTNFQNGLALVQAQINDGSILYKYIDTDNQVVYYWSIPDTRKAPMQDNEKNSFHNLLKHTLHFDSRELSNNNDL